MPSFGDNLIVARWRLHLTGLRLKCSACIRLVIASVLVATDCRVIQYRVMDSRCGHFMTARSNDVVELIGTRSTTYALNRSACIRLIIAAVPVSTGVCVIHGSDGIVELSVIFALMVVERSITIMSGAIRRPCA
jgi:hypothetical protein